MKPTILRRSIKYILVLITISIPTIASALEFNSPIGGGAIKDIPSLVRILIDSVLGATSVLFLLSFIWGGWLWMIAQGDPAKIKKSKSIMLWSALGVIVIVGSYGMIKFIVERLGLA